MRYGGEGALSCVPEIFKNVQMSGAQAGQRRRLDPSTEVIFGRLKFIYWILGPLKNSGRRVTRVVWFRKIFLLVMCGAVDTEGKGADWIGKDMGICKDVKVHHEFRMSPSKLDCLIGSWEYGSRSEGSVGEPEPWAS